MNKSNFLFTILILFVLPSWGQTEIEKNFYQGRFEEVLNLLKTIEEKDSATITDYGLAARSCEHLFDYQSAIANYQKILKLDSINRQATEGMASCYSYLGDMPNAFLCYQKILPSDTTNVSFWAQYASVLTELDKNDQAEKIYHKLSGSNSNNIFLARKEAFSVYNQKDYNRADSLFQIYLEKKPDDNASRLARANCLQKKEDYEPATEQLLILLQNDSLNLVAINKIAYIYFANLRNYSKAAPYYRKVNLLEKNSDPSHLINLGICEYFTGNHEVAAKLLDSLTNVVANEPSISFYAGLSYRKIGDLDKSQFFLEKAAELSIPAYTAEIYHQLGRIYDMKRMPQEAIAAFQKSIEYDTTNYIVLYDIATIYDEFRLGSTISLKYYQNFMSGCKATNSAEYIYASLRVEKLKEELFFKGN